MSLELADTKRLFRSELGMMNAKIDHILDIIEWGDEQKCSTDEDDTESTTTSMQYHQGEFHTCIMHM
eukprot:7041863-Ditylum_brightwellii.AAC.1